MRCCRNLAPKPEAQPAPSGIVERLQQSLAKLVRVQRTDAAGERRYGDYRACNGRGAAQSNEGEAGASTAAGAGSRRGAAMDREGRGARQGAGGIRAVYDGHTDRDLEIGAIGSFMIRIILFLFLVGVVALGAAVIADQTGDVTLSWSVWRIDTSLPVLVLAVLLLVLAAMLVWAIIRSFLNAPERVRRLRRERRQAKGRNAITQGLIAIGTGDHFAARRHADVAKRLAHQDPLAMLLHAQTAQLHGDRDGAQRAFHAMAERKDTRHARPARSCSSRRTPRRSPYAAVALAEEALKTAPAAAWASQAVLGFRCSQGDSGRRADNSRKQSRGGADRSCAVQAPARRAADCARARS